MRPPAYSTSMAESPEYRTLLKCLSSLVTALKLSPASVADELTAVGLLPPNNVTNQGTSVEQARQLATVILDRVLLVPSRYNDFLSVLSKYQWLGDIVNILQTTYHELYSIGKYSV